jgi:hypothetical protein
VRFRHEPVEVYAPELERILQGIGQLVMAIDARVSRIVRLLGEDEGEEKADT